jgi:hypothetical protein
MKFNSVQSSRLETKSLSKQMVDDTTTTRCSRCRLGRAPGQRDEAYRRSLE